MTTSPRHDKHEACRDDRPRCPTCGCRHLPVVYTRQRSQQTVRVRACRNCGRRIVTRETICG